MSDGIEEREERKVREQQQKQQDREDQLDRNPHGDDEGAPERGGS